MSLAHDDPTSDAGRLRQRGLRVTAPRLAILSMLDRVGGHRAVDELVLALHQAGYHHARTTVYNALDDLARAGLVRAAPVDAGALRYESSGPAHHHFVCRACGVISNVDVAEDLAERDLPQFDGLRVDELDVVYRGVCEACSASGRIPGDKHRTIEHRHGGENGHGANGRDENGRGENGHGREEDRSAGGQVIDMHKPNAAKALT